ncbi:HNH endonuclease [Mesorhizobium sp. Root172]|uniref:HNH endonuclease n=1 Tax=Mesorhizobium sp. Root172 TaxID=1736481 RepID=UPI0009EA6B5B|nr:HNH endonuclease signature motif containing protein [Mesorhizobium sp. Root172]
MESRDHIPAETVRAVLVEAGHRCAIPTCRQTTTEIAHIAPWATSKDNSAANLIALCPTCHTRYDQKKEIDRKSIQMYKHNLAILNNRYGEFERRLFSILAKTGDRVLVLGPGADVQVANAVVDGLLEDKKVPGMNFDVKSHDAFGREIFSRSFPLTFTYWVTEKGADFIRRFSDGDDLA